MTIAGRSRPRLDRAATNLANGGRTQVLDAADFDAIGHALEAVGTIDNVVLAVGSTKGVGDFAKVPLKDVRDGFAEKVFPQFAVAQAALPVLVPGGSLAFVSAITGQAAMPGTAGIAAANAAVAALVPVLATELRPLRVNAVSPGVIDTPWWDFLPEEQRKAAFEDFAGRTPVERASAGPRTSPRRYAS